MALHLLGSAALALLLSAGCMGELGGQDQEGAPQIVATSTQALSLGDSLRIFGGNFAYSTEDYTVLQFQGIFTTKSGQPLPVDLRIRPHWKDANQVVWSQVGPFANPFSQDDQLGTFEGDLTAINVSGTGTELASAPYRTRLTFGESIAIRKLEPVNATCSEPSRRLLGGFPYGIMVEAVGFTPVNFTYTISGEASRDRGRVYRRPANGNTGSFVVIPDPVPDDVTFQLVNLTVSALGTDGRERVNSLVFAVHRPIEYIDSGTFKVAEIMAPMPDSGCISGGSVGRSVTYTETHTETRTRQVAIDWSEAWNESGTETKTLSQAVTRGITITKNGSKTSTDTTTDTFGWSSETQNSSSTTWTWGGEVSAGWKGIIGGSFSGSRASMNGVMHSYGKNGSHSTSHSEAYTEGWAVGRDYSTTDTESWAFAKTRGYTLTKGGSEFWQVSSADSKSLAFTGQILPNQYGVFFRQTVRIALPGSLVAYDLCGNPTVVGKANFFDYNWSVDLAEGPTCPPYPTPKLPEAQCYITPCGN